MWPQPISPASMLEPLAGAGLLPRLVVRGGSVTDAAAGPGSRFLGAHPPPGTRSSPPSERAMLFGQL